MIKQIFKQVGIPIGGVILLLGYGCGSKPTTIYINNADAKKNKVVIDDTITVNPIADSIAYIKLSLLSGDHQVSINKKVETVDIDEKGGILNIDKRQYVKYNVEYRIEDKNQALYDQMIVKTMSRPVQVGDYLIFKKGEPYDSIPGYFAQKLKSKNSQYLISEPDFIVYSENLRFIVKDWDFDLDQDPVENIQMQNQSSAIRTKMYDASMFTLLTMFSGDYKMWSIKDTNAVTKQLIEMSVQPTIRQ